MNATLPIKDKSEARTPVRISRFKSSIRHTDPHRHNGYLELIFLTAGKGTHTIDGKKYAVQPPALFAVRRDQVHCWDLQTPGEGYVLIIRKEFADELTDGRLWTLLAAISVHNCLAITGNETVDRLWAVLLDELSPPATSLPELAKWILKALLAKTLEMFRPALSEISNTQSLYQRFLRQLDTSTASKRTVHYYARCLHTTPQNLNNACRKDADRSTTEILADFLIKEAKRLLLYTNGTVAEIAFTLDFKDPSHFVKYFRRMTGQTPLQFRNE